MFQIVFLLSTNKIDCVQLEKKIVLNQTFQNDTLLSYKTGIMPSEYQTDLCLVEMLMTWRNFHTYWQNHKAMVWSLWNNQPLLNVDLFPCLSG